MTTTRSIAQILVAFALLSITACSQGSTESPANIQVTKITETQQLIGVITQVKTYDQCEAGGPLQAKIQFSELNTNSQQSELTLTAGGSLSGGAPLPNTAKFELQGSIQEKFASINTTAEGYQEIIELAIPAKTNQQYEFTWKEVRQDGTIEYTENGEPKTASFSYRIGLSFDHSTAKDLGCPAQPPSPADEDIPATTPPTTGQSMANGCISSTNWAYASTNETLSDLVSINSNGCYSLEPLGISASGDGKVKFIIKDSRDHLRASGIYTGIKDNSTISFDIYVKSLYIVWTENPARIVFAVAPNSTVMESISTARFQLHVEDAVQSPTIYFSLADVGEGTGFKNPDQHYKYKRSYNIRLVLSGITMKTYINDIKTNEDVIIPSGPKVFYMGYNLPLNSSAEIEISNLTIDGVQQ